MSRTANRFTGAALAILIQAGLLFLLLLSHPTLAPRQNLARELTFILPRLTEPKTEAAPPAIDARRRPRPAVPTPAIAPPPSATSATPAPSPDLSGLGQSLFGCALENRSSLTPEQRARCPGDGATGQPAPDPLGTRSHTKDYAHWAAELAARKSIRVPCTSIEGLAHGAQALMVDPICVSHELDELAKKLR